MDDLYRTKKSPARIENSSKSALTVCILLVWFCLCLSRTTSTLLITKTYHNARTLQFKLLSKSISMSTFDFHDKFWYEGILCCCYAVFNRKERWVVSCSIHLEVFQIYFLTGLLPESCLVHAHFILKMSIVFKWYRNIYAVFNFWF